MKLAAQLFTLREFMKTPEDVERSLRKVKEIGYNAVQASGAIAVSDEEFKRLTDEIGLTICATHIPYDDLVHRMDDVIAKHKLWGCKYVGLGSMPGNFREHREGIEEFARQISEFGRALDAAGLKFIYHNHAFEFAKYGDATAMDILFEKADSTVDFELDVYWVQAGGADPIEWIRKVNGRMKVVHLKDMAVTPKQEQRFAEVGEGNMNFKGILEACREIGVEWAAVEQDQCYDRDPFESLAISFRNLTKMGVEA